MNARILQLLVLLSLSAGQPWANAPAATTNTLDLQAIFARQILSPTQVLSEVQDYLEPRVPVMPAPASAREWTRYADRLRQDILQRVVLRGEAARWAKLPLRVEWLETIPGGPGYHIRKVLYEAVPGFWIPALLYEPDAAAGKLPVVLDVSGHDAKGNVAGYKQIHCINQVKRGMLALNVDWIGMGQLSQPNYIHSRMNQLDLCGTSGLAPFYLSLKHGLDVLLSLPNADPRRVAVTGYSGGGWQSIFISALDRRVTLANPVAGYSSYRTRVRHLKDLGDSEQTPCDLATLADYTHLTAMLAGRAALLTYNAKDDCCFEAGYGLPPLIEAAQPIFTLLGQPTRLRTHINFDPGNHNYERDNREAFYGMVRDEFYAGDAGFSAVEIPSAAEVKTKEQLEVPMPQPNADFNSLALALSRDLPRAGKAPAGGAALAKSQVKQRARLREVVKAKEYRVQPATVAQRQEEAGLKVTHWRLRVGGAWTLPASEVVRGQPRGTTLLLTDSGRRGAAEQAERLLAAGQRVVALDPFYFGECKSIERGYLWPLLVSAVGERPLGWQASQVAAVARWLRAEHPAEPVTLCAVGPRSSTVALVAAALEKQACAGVELHGALPSLKVVIQQNHTFDEMPEMFCFGLLAAFDMEQLRALSQAR